MDIEKNNLKREFTHSLSRVADRLNQVVADYSRIQEDTQRIWRDAEGAKRDVVKLKQAIESLSNDLLKVEMKKCEEPSNTG